MAKTKNNLVYCLSVVLVSGHPTHSSLTVLEPNPAVHLFFFVKTLVFSQIPAGTSDPGPLREGRVLKERCV